MSREDGFEGAPVPPQLPIIGWREWFSIPELGICGIKSKIDTGARTSSLHTHDYRVYKTAEGTEHVTFHLHPIRGRDDLEITCDAPVHSYREVKDSGGHVELRPFIQVTINLGPYQWPVEFSLTNREAMKFRSLLGRVALKERFLVDPTQSYLLGPSLSKAYSQTKASTE